MTDIVPIPDITPHPPTPQRNDPATFAGKADAGIVYTYDVLPVEITAVANAARTNAIASQERAVAAQQSAGDAALAVTSAGHIVSEAESAAALARAWAESPTAPAPGSKSAKSHADDAGTYAQSAAASAQAAGAAAGLPSGGEAGQALVLQPGPNPGDPLSPQWGFAGSQVGDVIQTVRNPGANYLVTRNVYLQSEYPELFGLVGLVPNSLLGSSWDTLPIPADLSGQDVQALGLSAADDDGFYWLIPGKSSLDTSRVVYTTDEGATTSRLDMSGYGNSCLSADSGILVCVGGNPNTLNISVNKGEFSQKTAENIASGEGSNLKIVATGTYAGIIYAAVETRSTSTSNKRVGLWVSDDLGETWIRNIPFGFVTGVSSMGSSYYVLVYGKTIVVGFTGQDFISQDSGASFSLFTYGYGGAQQSSLNSDVFFSVGSASPARTYQIRNVSDIPTTAINSVIPNVYSVAVDRKSKNIVALMHQNTTLSLNNIASSADSGRSFSQVTAVPTDGNNRMVKNSMLIHNGILLAVGHITNAADRLFRTRTGFDYDPATHFYLPGNSAPVGITEYVRAK